MGGGLALLDIEGDGDLDLYLVDGGADASDPAARGEVTNRLFENVEGQRFREREAGGGAPGSTYGMGAAVGDVDGDGTLDLYVANLGRDDVYRNEGTAFSRIDQDGPASVDGWSCSAAFLDQDRDGDLDLFVTQYVVYTPHKRCFDHADRRDYCGPTSFDPVPDRFLVNDGDGSLTDVGEAAGIAEVAAAGLGVVVHDVTEDGWPDVYVANDTYANNLWVNQRDGTFVDDAVILGAAFDMHGNHEAGMGVVAADFDGDERLDLFMTHLKRETNTLYRNLGPEVGFVDATGASGLGPSSRSWTGFGTAALDLELDGDLDLLIVNGKVARGEPDDAIPLPPPWNLYAEPALLYLNDGSGTFTPEGDRSPSFCDAFEVGRGLAFGDLDGDGDADLVRTSIEGWVRVHRNEAPREGRPLVVTALAGGRPALGAVVHLVEGDRRQARLVARSSGYLSSSDPRAFFGRGEGSEASVEVAWPGGACEVFDVALEDTFVTVVQGDGREVP